MSKPQNTVLVAKTGKTTFLPLTDNQNDIEAIKRVFAMPDIDQSQVKDFNLKEGKLVEAEWFSIPISGADESFIAPWVDAACEPIDAERVADLDLGQIKGLALVKTTGLISESVVQMARAGKSLAFDRKVSLGFDVRGVHTQEVTRGFELPKQTNALYRGGKLYFKQFSAAASLVRGIENFFLAASNPDVNEFCDKEMFLLGEDFDPATLNRSQRIRIAKSLPQMPDFSEESVRKQIAEYAKEYFVGSDAEMVQGDRLQIRSAKDLNAVFHALFGDYYTNGITNEMMIAKKSEKMLLEE
jgi:hypothetical protein